jgi:uncharacterized protein
MTVTNQDTARIQTIDIIRGIALFGILVINIQTYTLFAFLRPEQVYRLQLDSPGNYIPADFFIQIFIKGQFISIYGFLFGLGTFLILQKNKSRKLNAERIFKRRLWTLLIIGIVHAFIFWFGDILHIYALLGFTLLYFNKKSVSVILKWITWIGLCVIVLKGIKLLFLPTDPQSFLAGQQKADELIMHVVHAWQHGSVIEVIGLQKLGVVMLHFMDASNGFDRLAQVEIMFLLGMIVGKMQVFYHIKLYQERLIKLVRRIFPVALLLKSVSAFPVLNIHFLPAHLQGHEKLIYSVSAFIGTPLLCIGYLVLMAIFFQKRTSRFWKWIANTGRLGLTNYLMQTMLCMLLFYGYALGLSGRLTLIESFIPAILIYCFQVLFSNIWVSYQKTGPMEKYWRRMAYYKEPVPTSGKLIQKTFKMNETA